MLAPFGIGGVVEGRASEFRGPHDERVFHHPALFEITQQRGDGLIDVLRQWRVGHHVAVRVPVAGGAGVDEFDETHAALDETSRGEALPAEAGVLPPLETVAGESGIGLLFEIERGRHGHLHAEGGFEGLHSRGEQRIAGTRGEVLLVHLTQRGEFELLAVCRQTRCDIRDGFRPGHDERALIRSRQEVARKDLSARVGLLRRDDDEAGQIAVQRTEAISHPRAHAGPRLRERARVHTKRGVVVVRVRGVHRANQRDVVHAASDVRKQRAHLRAALPVLRKLPLRSLQINALVTRPAFDLGMVGLDLLAVALHQLRLRIKAVHVRDTAGHEEEDDVLRLRREMRFLGCERVGAVREQSLHDARENERSGGGGAEELASRDGWGVHGLLHLIAFKINTAAAGFSRSVMS